MEFDARIDAPLIRCTVTSDRSLAAPVLCFSCMAPIRVVDGGERIAALGGYAEVRLPDLSPGTPHHLTLRHDNPDYAPTNRAWLPLGAYLRSDDGPIALPPLPAGVRPRPFRADGPAPALRLCPQPRGFAPTGGTLKADSFRAAPDLLVGVDALARRTGLGAFLDDAGVPLDLRPNAGCAPEGYRLEITPEGVTLHHRDEAGARHGAITLLTLRTTHGGRLPCGEIEDAPRFEWRGQHLDCARHFYEVDTILRLLDLMALMKLNRFHWHFADDEAVRLDLPRLPELRRTHIRGEGELLPGLFGGGIRSGGGYSRADAERIIAHAQDLGIEVMPEIEVPAHALALARVYPGTRDPNDAGTEVSVQGYPENVMNPAMEESWRIWEAMVADVAAIFPFGVIHLGCDELPPGAWAGSPAAEALKTREGLDTTDDLQGWIMHRLAGRVAGMGRVPAAWEEAARGAQGIGHQAILFSWTGQGPGLDAARAGHPVVMTPGQHLYLDMAHTDDPEDWGASWAAIIGLEDTIAWEPVPDDEPELEDRIIGVQATFWSEFTTRDAEMEPMLAPRILGPAMMGWQARGTPDPGVLSALAQEYRAIFDAMGWRHAMA
ncbi:family 20 glycosylhydrolase [Ponticoccus sp. SC2-23]|uniref:beta-N-acetylhexosaminidase n=1 Tax=Alexandriicola marinus TaxID=2081710 RepID=UPI000FD74181|nr:family 20 glycosylhydrolase [Alexandriicola marinus]MBM1220925.1 family 20 glycosylhydrolase [Ponticoccus sp. SC6-9]MBM1225495.1 family 20 glycosylhydrolase [Ponticoccus sp. SC6-15]MBM1227678.1 family 20 glycosylhydrolase [Ponticoccus sp. SC6-38]MBM1234684.1 family 20 glycosylhydrolase [Ponticoccus sp. SC6-45]MBM1238180.1 family 20 glycosylhydrolase [Ponticoccus sp. SC6-49]MBM1244187.1 family 20 glycosylhydrolase [Ponticoccus sp. SC2-64]MBM1248208.1 family 20 glycosylhydrolase [Ponticoccu